jgi:hypothetical protein
MTKIRTGVALAALLITAPAMACTDWKAIAMIDQAEVSTALAVWLKGGPSGTPWVTLNAARDRMLLTASTPFTIHAETSNDPPHPLSHLEASRAGLGVAAAIKWVGVHPFAAKPLGLAAAAQAPAGVSAGRFVTIPLPLTERLNICLLVKLITSQCTSGRQVANRCIGRA